MDLEGTSCSSKVAMVAEKHLRVEFRSELPPLLAGHARQASSPVMEVEQLGHCQVKVSVKLLVRRMCFCTARCRELSWHTRFLETLSFEL
jgi:hypothetical protein